MNAGSAKKSEDFLGAMLLLKLVCLLGLFLVLINSFFLALNESRFISSFFSEFSYGVFDLITYSGVIILGLIVGYKLKEATPKTWVHVSVGIISALLAHMTFLFIWHKWHGESLFGIFGIVVILLISYDLWHSFFFNKKTVPMSFQEMASVKGPEINCEDDGDNFRNRIDRILMQSGSIRNSCNYILQNLVENEGQEKQLDLIYNIENIKQKIFRLDDIACYLEEDCISLLHKIIPNIEKKGSFQSEEAKNIMMRARQLLTEAINDLMNDINFLIKFDEFRNTHFLFMGEGRKILEHAGLILDDIDYISTHI